MTSRAELGRWLPYWHLPLPQHIHLDKLLVSLVCKLHKDLSICSWALSEVPGALMMSARALGMVPGCLMKKLLSKGGMVIAACICLSEED